LNSSGGSTPPLSSSGSEKDKEDEDAVHYSPTTPTQNHVLLSEEVDDDLAIENTPQRNMQSVGHIVGLSVYGSFQSRTEKSVSQMTAKSNRSNSLH